MTIDLFTYTYNLVRQIPDGKVSTYGAVAEALGNKVASRAVGRMMNQNPNADTMPCYKIVHSDGRLGGFGGHPEDKIKRLGKVGIQVKDGKLVDFESVFFNDFTTEYPLKKLRQEQIKESKDLILTDDFEKIETIAGIDVAYPESEWEDACAVAVVIDYATGERVEEKTILAPTRFPFISTYFSYREFPLVERVFKVLTTKPSILLLDGNGILHPYTTGFASHAGLRLDIPTIGVAKTLLYGKQKNHTIFIDNEPRGCALIPKSATTPIYVSPGHRISLETSVSLVQQLCLTKNPVPLRYAHQLAQERLQKHG